MRLLDKIFGTKPPQAAMPAIPLPDHANEDEYVRACSEPAFADEAEERTFRSDPAFQGVLDPLNARDYLAAIKAAERLLSRYDDFDLPYKWLGSAYRATNQLARSEEILRRGLSKARRKSILLTDIGETAWRMGNVHEAVYVWCQALHCLARNPVDYNAYLLLAYVAGACGLHEIEQRLLERVDEFRPGRVRLDAATAQGLTSLVRDKKDSALTRAIQAVDARYAAVPA